MRKAKTTKVTLRFRMLNTGKETLYLDYYPGIPNPKTGETMRREYLGMYVVPLKKKERRTTNQQRRFTQVQCRGRGNDTPCGNHPCQQAERTKQSGNIHRRRSGDAESQRTQ